MNRLRLLFVALMVVVVALALGKPARSAFVSSQRDQIAVPIIVNVLPYTGYKPAGVAAPMRIAARMALRGRGSALYEDAPNFVLGNAVAQAQSAVRVQANVSPNPNATMLYSNQAQVSITQAAGTTASTASCVYTVTVDTPSTTSWTLDDGLSGDFISSAWPGGDLSNNTYLQGSTPQPAATPFVVYATNNNNWYPKEKSSGMKTYCVTLTLTIPSTVQQGTYSTNAIYTLFF